MPICDPTSLNEVFDLEFFHPGLELVNWAFHFIPANGDLTRNPVVQDLYVVVASIFPQLKDYVGSKLRELIHASIGIFYPVEVMVADACHVGHVERSEDHADCGIMGTVYDYSGSKLTFYFPLNIS